MIYRVKFIFISRIICSPSADLDLEWRWWSSEYEMCVLSMIYTPLKYAVSSYCIEWGNKKKNTKEYFKMYNVAATPSLVFWQCELTKLRKLATFFRTQIFASNNWSSFFLRSFLFQQIQCEWINYFESVILYAKQSNPINWCMRTARWFFYDWTVNLNTHTRMDMNKWICIRSFENKQGTTQNSKQTNQIQTL